MRYLCLKNAKSHPNYWPPFSALTAGSTRPTITLMRGFLRRSALPMRSTALRTWTCSCTIWTATSHCRKISHPEDVGRFMIRIRNGREWLRYIGPGGDFMKGLAATIEGIVSLNLEPDANPPTAEELELWELERRDIAGEFDPPDEKV